MLAKSRRFKTEDFKKMRKMQTLHSPHFFIRFCSVLHGEEKTAVIVSSGTYKKAVDRNKLRRRMYHIVAKNKDSIVTKACTVTFKKGALLVPFQELEKEFSEITKKMRCV